MLPIGEIDHLGEKLQVASDVRESSSTELRTLVDAQWKHRKGKTYALNSFTSADMADRPAFRSLTGVKSVIQV